MRHLWDNHKNLEFGNDSNLTWIFSGMFFFSGIWISFHEYCPNDHENFFLWFWEHETLWSTKILIFWWFLDDLWLIAEKKSAFFRFFSEMGFFSWCHFWLFFGVFFRWCGPEGSKMIQNSWKLIFPDFSDNSREKQIFVNFWSFLAILRCITFMKDSNLGHNKGILA